MTLNIPIKLVSLANSRHWRERATYSGNARGVTAKVIHFEHDDLKAVMGADSYKITFVCHGTRIRDDDNLASAVKPIRDEVCVWLGIDDGRRAPAEFRVTWGRKGGAPSVDVEIAAERKDGAK